jgi:hypothetical protein
MKKKKKKGAAYAELERTNEFLAEAKKRGMTYAQLQVEETCEGLRRQGFYTRKW